MSSVEVVHLGELLDLVELLRRDVILVIVHQVILELGLSKYLLDVHPVGTLTQVNHDSLHDTKNILMRHHDGLHLSNVLAFETGNGFVGQL